MIVPISQRILGPMIAPFRRQPTEADSFGLGFFHALPVEKCKSQAESCITIPFALGHTPPAHGFGLIGGDPMPAGVSRPEETRGEHIPFVGGHA